jgi:hypothetical protein
VSAIFEPPLRGQNPVQAWSGVVANTITDEATPMYVLLDNWAEDVQIGPCRWMPRPALSASPATVDNHYCLLNRSGVGSVLTGTWTRVAFDNELNDPFLMHSLVSNTSRITILQDGLYFLFAWQLINGAAGGSNRIVAIIKNDTSVSGAPNGEALVDQGPGVTSWSALTRLDAAGFAPLVAGDYIETFVFQDSGSTQNIQGAGRFGAINVKRADGPVTLNKIFPTRGDPCLVVFDNNNYPWVTNWWPYG